MLAVLLLLLLLVILHWSTRSPILAVDGYHSCFYSATNPQQHLLRLRLCRQFVKLKSRQEFRSAAALSDRQAIEFSIALAETQLDNVTRQRQLLNELRDEGNLKGPK